MFLLNDIDLPYKLEHIDYNSKIRNFLLTLSKNKHLTHLLLYGPKSCGKKTFIKCFLNNFFNSNIISKNKQFILSNNHTITYSYNKYYYELYPSDYYQDNIILLKEFIEYIKYSLCHNIIVIYNIHNFICDTYFLKQITEKYSNITLIMTNNKKIHLFMNLCVRSLTTYELEKISIYINHKAQLNLSFENIQEICIKSKRNLNNLYINLQDNKFEEYYNLDSIVNIILNNDITEFPLIQEKIKTIIIKNIYPINKLLEEIVSKILKKTTIPPTILYNIISDLELDAQFQKYKHIFVEILIINIYKLLN